MKTMKDTMRKFDKMVLLCQKAEELDNIAGHNPEMYVGRRDQFRHLVKDLEGEIYDAWKKGDLSEMEGYRLQQFIYEMSEVIES